MIYVNFNKLKQRNTIKTSCERLFSIDHNVSNTFNYPCKSNIHATHFMLNTMVNIANISELLKIQQYLRQLEHGKIDGQTSRIHKNISTMLLSVKNTSKNLIIELNAKPSLKKKCEVKYVTCIIEIPWSIRQEFQQLFVEKCKIESVCSLTLNFWRSLQMYKFHCTFF